MERGDRFFIKETGDVIEFRGRQCDDYHKGSYSDYYNIISLSPNSPYSDKLKNNYSIDEDELYYHKHTLVRCTKDNVAIPVLFGK